MCMGHLFIFGGTGGGGGYTHFLPVLPESPPALIIMCVYVCVCVCERGGGGSCTFFPRAQNCIFFLLSLVLGYSALKPKLHLTKYFDKNGKKQVFAFRNLCPNSYQFACDVHVRQFAMISALSVRCQRRQHLPSDNFFSRTELK